MIEPRCIRVREQVQEELHDYVANHENASNAYSARVKSNGDGLGHVEVVMQAILQGANAMCQKSAKP